MPTVLTSRALPVEKQIEDYVMHQLKGLIPLGYPTPENRPNVASTGLEAALDIGGLGGFAVRRGLPAEQGVDPEQMRQLYSKASLIRYFQEKAKENASTMSPGELRKLERAEDYFTQSQLKSLLRGRKRPVAIKQHEMRRAIRKLEIFQRKQK